MTRFSKTALLLGAALAVLSACSGTKGPGEIGTKEDIIVRNNGLPGSAKAPAPDADFSSTVEQAEAIPAPAVETAEPLPNTSPAVEAAAEQMAAANAPVPSTASMPVNQTNTGNPAPVSENKPIDQVVPATPVQDAANITPPAQTAAVPTPVPATVSAPVPAPTTAPSASSSVYPAEDYAAAGVTPPAAAPTVAPAPQPVPAEPAASPNAYVPVPAGTDYPFDPNAPYSPKAMAGAGTALATTTPVVSASGLNLSDPAVVRSAQTALKAKGGYMGEATGTIDAAFLNALTVYQGQNKLPQGGLNEDTLRHLGVIE